MLLKANFQSDISPPNKKTFLLATNKSLKHHPHVMQLQWMINGPQAGSSEPPDAQLARTAVPEGSRCSPLPLGLSLRSCSREEPNLTQPSTPLGSLKWRLD